MEEFMTVLRKWSDFDGRARRREYWMFVLIYIILSWVVTFVASYLGSVGSILSMAFSLLMLVPSISVLIRRMHDVGKSGWFCLIPIYNLILTLTAGEVGPNEYGPDPKGGAGDISDHLMDNETV
jgi:uncharacterized membrane protein YhaH (DUF805 family)